MRVEKGNFNITSHELENDGRRFVERALGKTVNPSTISRKWRLLKRDYKEPRLYGLDTGEDQFVTVMANKRSKREGSWAILDLNGVDVDTVRGGYELQLKLF